MSDEFPITDFLMDSELPAGVDGLFDWAELEIVILSPWIQLTGHQEDLLKVKIADGLNVTLLTRQPLPNNVEHGETVERFQQLGGSVYFDNKLHAKMVLADRSVVLVMSSNIIPSSLRDNHEIGIISQDRNIVESTLGYLSFLEDVLDASILKRSDEKFESGKTRLRKFPSRLLKRKQSEEEQLESKKCPECGVPLEIIKGDFGTFWGCTGFSRTGCRYKRNIQWKRIIP